MDQQHMHNIRQAWQQKSIAVLMGGMSSEREISQKTGTAILQALLRKGYQAMAVDVDRNVGLTLREHGIQVAYIALHGSLGEDGTIQGLLEIMGIPYTGSGVLASALAINKVAAKKLFRYHGIMTPEFQSFQTAGISTADIQSRITTPLPFVVKPAEEGSTIGISIVSSRQDLPAALERACGYGAEVLVEAFITGREITVGVIDGRPLPPVEIRPKSGFYDFTSKYTKGKTEYLVPAPLDPAAAAVISDAAAAAYHALGCRGNARVDFILSAEGRPFVLEVNTIPGMTETSLLPMAAREAGIDFDTLVEMILWSATLDKRFEKA
jgi:D-alanine-D-alanine ligase